MFLCSLNYNIFYSKPAAREEQLGNPSALPIRSTSTSQNQPPHVKTDSLPSNADGGSGGRRGDGMSGRSQFQECADSSGHLGEPSLLQNVQRKTQLTLTKTEENKQTKKNNGEGSTNGKGMEKLKTNHGNSKGNGTKEKAEMRKVAK